MDLQKQIPLTVSWALKVWINHGEILDKGLKSAVPEEKAKAEETARRDGDRRPTERDGDRRPRQTTTEATETKYLRQQTRE